MTTILAKIEAITEAISIVNGSDRISDALEHLESELVRLRAQLRKIERKAG